MRVCDVIGQRSLLDNLRAQPSGTVDNTPVTTTTTTTTTVQPEEDDVFDVPEAIEPILDMLLTGLADKDTVRLALAAFLRVLVACVGSIR